MEAVWFKSGHHGSRLTGELPVVVCLGIADGFEQAMVLHQATAQALTPHQALDSATCHRQSLTCQLLPDLVGTVDLQVALPDS